MKSRNSVLEPIKQALEVAEGGVSSACYRFSGNTSLYHITIPYAGLAAEHISVKQVVGAVTIGPKDDPTYNEVRLPIDDEYLTIVGWTVINGMFRMLIKYEVPAKYLVVNTLAPMTVDEYNDALSRIK